MSPSAPEASPEPAPTDSPRSLYDTLKPLASVTVEASGVITES